MSKACVLNPLAINPPAKGLCDQPLPKTAPSPLDVPQLDSLSHPGTLRVVCTLPMPVGVPQKPFAASKRPELVFRW